MIKKRNLKIMAKKTTNTSTLAGGVAFVLVPKIGVLEDTDMATSINSRVFRIIPLLIVLLALYPVKGQAQDERPVAEAGLPRYAAQDPVVLDGTSSYDPEHSGPLSFNWQQIAGPSAVITDANKATPTISSFVQTDDIQECEFELVVSNGELTSLPDTVKVIIVPDFGQNFVRHVNPPFDPNIPTLIFFGPGDCVNGNYTWKPSEESVKDRTWNKIEFHDGFMPDEKSGADWRTYYGCGDMIIVYLSSVTPDYKMPIQTVGFSTGGLPAVDTGIRLNLTYRDARYAVNRVTLEDASTYCRGSQGYSESIAAFVASSVDGEQCWLDNYVSYNADFYPNVLNVGFERVDHILAYNWYGRSFTNAELSKFNSGVVAGAYWTVKGPGKNLQLASTPGVETYKFKWYGDAYSGYMDFYDEPNHPGMLPEPVTLVGPVDVEDPNRFVLTCLESENAVGYELLFGNDPSRVMDYDIISDTHDPPNYVISTLPNGGIWWTIRVRDQYGSTIYADPKYISMSAYNPIPADGAMHPASWVNLSWTEGMGSISYDVYFGANLIDVKAGTTETFLGNQTYTSFRLGSARSAYLVPGTTYFWRIDDVGADGTLINKGRIWSFTVSP